MQLAAQAKHGSGRCGGPVDPEGHRLKTDANPQGVPLAAFDQLRAAVRTNRSQLFRDFAVSFYGYNREGARRSQGVLDAFWLQSMQGGIKGEYDCIKQFSESDFTEDLKKLDVPTLIVHGDDDQIVPIEASALRTSKLVRDATLKVYKGGPHGVASTRPDELNADLLAFVESVGQRPSAPSEPSPLTH